MNTQIAGLQETLEDALSHLSSYLELAKQHGLPLTLGTDETGYAMLDYAVERVDEAFRMIEEDQA